MRVLADIVIHYRSLISFKKFHSVKVTHYSTYYTEKPEANGALILRCLLSQPVLRFTGIFKNISSYTEGKEVAKWIYTCNQIPNLPHIRPCLSSLFLLRFAWKNQGVFRVQFQIYDGKFYFSVAKNCSGGRH